MTARRLRVVRARFMLVFVVIFRRLAVTAGGIFVMRSCVVVMIR
jgi:hypothetical protein